ncbi:hypothetical protein PC123_g18266 [Phytophthora cactorum]|nr:hypothetical protein PC123_g18266 [Phytophthora cactorum]
MDETEREDDLANLTMRNREGTSVWNVEQLCQRFDGCKWFAESGDKTFPSIAKLARVWMG